MGNITVRHESQVARPLSVLVPLIRDDLEQIENAGLPYKQAVGEKLNEAKEQVKHGEWGAWLQRNFELSQTTAQRYMSFSKDPNSSNGSFSSLNDYHRQTGSPAYRNVVSKQLWHEDVKESIEHAKREAERIRKEQLTRQQEREADRKLALDVIEIGFKVLAKELHPDRKGGSHDAMSRLNRVRDRLRQYI